MAGQGTVPEDKAAARGLMVGRVTRLEGREGQGPQTRVGQGTGPKDGKAAHQISRQNI